MRPMRRTLIPTILTAALPTAAAAQTSFEFKLDAMFRDEWTRDIFQAPNQERWRFQARPRLELGAGAFHLGVGADFNHSSEDNVEVEPPPLIVRDNYSAKDLRLDLAFARIEAGSWLRVQGGRFFMPVGLTEMLWDRDLRPQGAALTLRGTDSGGRERVGLTVLGARGSHVFEDDDTEMLLVSASASWPGAEGGFELAGSFLTFRDLELLEPIIRRQNTRLAPGGVLSEDYRVIDLLARWRKESGLNTQLVADVSWNTAVDEGGRGLWLGLALGSVRTARARVEYTYAKVDQDATVAAYNSDDFFWGTGWEGHRGDLGIRVANALAVHVTGQLQRFKDSPRPEEREEWVRRLRVDVRLNVE